MTDAQVLLRASSPRTTSRLSRATLAPHLRLNARVLGISRRGFETLKSVGRERAPFLLRSEPKPVAKRSTCRG